MSQLQLDQEIFPLIQFLMCHTQVHEETSSHLQYVSHQFYQSDNSKPASSSRPCATHGHRRINLHVHAQVLPPRHLHCCNSIQIQGVSSYHIHQVIHHDISHTMHKVFVPYRIKVKYKTDLSSSMNQILQDHHSMKY